jgi:glutathione S-transferase
VHGDAGVTHMADVRFLSMPDSAYLWTAMHVADEKGLTYEFVPVTYRSPEHLKLHPFGKMPMLQHGDKFIYETLAIAHYLDSAFDGPRLQPADPFGQARMLQWISIVNSYVFPTMNRFTKERLVKPAMGIDIDPEFIVGAQEPLFLQLRLIEEALSQHEYLVGKRLTLADSFLLPHLLFFTRTPEGKALIPKTPGAAAWLQRMMQRPSYAKSPMSGTFEIFHLLPAKPELVWSTEDFTLKHDPSCRSAIST